MSPRARLGFAPIHAGLASLQHDASGRLQGCHITGMRHMQPVAQIEMPITNSLRCGLAWQRGASMASGISIAQSSGVPRPASGRPTPAGNSDAVRWHMAGLARSRGCRCVCDTHFHRGCKCLRDTHVHRGCMCRDTHFRGPGPRSLEARKKRSDICMSHTPCFFCRKLTQKLCVHAIRI